MMTICLSESVTPSSLFAVHVLDEILRQLASTVMRLSKEEVQGMSLSMQNNAGNHCLSKHSYVESLRSRIRELEQICGKITSGQIAPVSQVSGRNKDIAHTGAQPNVEHQVIASDNPRTTQQRLSPYEASSSDHQTPGELIHGWGSSISPALDADDNSETDEDDHIGADAMGTQGGSPSEYGGDRRFQIHDYFGPSSAVGFMRQVRRATSTIGDGVSGTGDLEDPTLTNLPSFTSALPVHERPKQHQDSPSQFRFTSHDYSIPPRAEADALVEGYFHGVHTHYPYIHRSTFMQKYLQIWEPGPFSVACDRVFHCLLNAVFSLGAHFSSSIDPHERVTTSGIYHDRLTRLLTFDLLGHGSLELIQTLLLMAQYLQSTDMSGLCWNIVGIAVRMAQSIGLHLDSSGFRKRRMSQVDVEMRRRVWGGCVTLDR